MSRVLQFIWHYIHEVKKDVTFWPTQYIKHTTQSMEDSI